MIVIVEGRIDEELQKLNVSDSYAPANAQAVIDAIKSFSIEDDPRDIIKQRVIYEVLLKISDSEIFNQLMALNSEHRKALKSALPHYNLYNIQARYEQLHADTPDVQTTRYETDEGILHQIRLKQKDDTIRTVNFSRNYSFGSERILMADPVEMSADEWKMFVDRGHGMYATSLVTRTIATIGMYIAEVERAYGLQPVKDSKTGEYHLSKNDLAILKDRDPNAYQKYQLIRQAQEQLRGFYELERKLDPNHTELQRDFKHGLRKVIDELRSALYQQKQLTVDRMPVSSDHIMAFAHEGIMDFEWPNDSKARRYAITEADQLLVKKGGRIAYDPSNEPSSAAGGSVFFTTSGFGKEGRDNFAHCLSLMDGFDRTQRSAFMKEVSKLTPSEGAFLEITSRKKRARETEAIRLAHVVLRAGADIQNALTTILEPYSTTRGQQLCQARFGCSYNELKTRVYYQMMVHATDEQFNTISSIINDDAEIVQKTKLRKPAESKREARKNELEKIKQAIQKKAPDAVVKTPDRTQNARDLFQAHAECIVDYYVLVDCETIQDFRKNMNRIMGLYSQDFCTQVLGASRRELQEEVLRRAMLEKKMGKALFEAMEQYAKDTNRFGALVAEAKKAREEKKQATADTTPRHAERFISRAPDSLLEVKAKDIAEHALTQADPLNAIKDAAAKRAPNQRERLVASSVYRLLLECSDAQYEELATDKEKLQELLLPYHNLSNVSEIRGFLKAISKAKEDFDKIYQEKYKEELSEKLKNISDEYTIQHAVEDAKQASLADEAVQAAKAKLDQATKQLHPHLLNTDRETGDVLLRTGPIGYVYKLVDPIMGALERMGLQDPIRGTLALGILGATMSYVMIAHGASVAAASAHSKYMAALTKTYVIPEAYKNIVVLTPESGTVKTVFAGLVDGVTLGEAFYILSSTADIAASNHLTGFTGNVINGIMNNPVETGLLIAVMVAAGHGMVIGLHEQAVIGKGGWEFLTGFFEALKPGAVAFDTALEIVKIVAHPTRIYAEGLEKSTKMEDHFAQLLAENVFAALGEEQKKAFPLATLKKSFVKAFEGVDLTNPAQVRKVKDNFLSQFADAQKTVLSEAMRGKVSEANTKQDELAKALKEELKLPEKNVSEAQKIRYGLCLQQGLELLAANPKLDKHEVVNSVMAMIPAIERQALDFSPIISLMRTSPDKTSADSALACLEKLYRDDATEFDSGLTEDEKKSPEHRKHKQEYLCDLFVKEILQEKSEQSHVWAAILKDSNKQKMVEDISGVPFDIILNQDVPKEMTGWDKAREVAKNTFVSVLNPSPAAAAEGLGKMANLHARVIANIAGAVGTATIRTVTALTPSRLGLHRAEAHFASSGQEAARLYSRTTGKYTVVRPDGISPWRRSFTAPELVGKAAIASDVKVAKKDFYRSCKDMVSGSMRNFGNDFFLRLGRQVGEIFAKHPLIKKNADGNTVKNDFEDELSKQLLDLLKPLFPQEVAKLNTLLDEKGVRVSEDRDAYMLGALQKLCHDEVMMCSDTEREALAKQPDLVQLLVGQSIDFSSIHHNSVDEISYRITEQVEKARDVTYYTGCVEKMGADDRFPVPSSRFDKGIVVNVDLLTPKTVDTSKMETGQSASQIDLNALKDALIKVVAEYKQQKKWKIKFSGLTFSYLIKNLITAVETFPKDVSPEKAALHVLTKLLPTESAQIDALMADQRISAENRDQIKLQALQEIFYKELIAAREKSQTAFSAFCKAFSGDHHKELRQLLTGRENDLSTPASTLSVVVSPVVAGQRPVTPSEASKQTSGAGKDSKPEPSKKG